MASLLYVNDDDSLKKINIDDLYEKKKQRDLKQISIFNKILNRIHKRITLTGRTNKNDKFIWFSIPEYIFGEPIYDKGDCIAYVVSKLEDNGFYIKYLHPNTLFISWENWVPTYVRNEIKKKRGIILDENGNIIGSDKQDKPTEDNNPYSSSAPTSSSSNAATGKKEGKQYNPISNYKPTGNLVYNQEMFDKLEKKIIL